MKVVLVSIKEPGWTLRERRLKIVQTSLGGRRETERSGGRLEEQAHDLEHDEGLVKWTKPGGIRKMAGGVVGE